ncbi:MAG TPA: Flp pilus assembly protein CpaB [Acidimicrobiales bacterium]|nr:Flp pilus assembly protein CpaB [Acidimicrobiales bacterium]
MTRKTRATMAAGLAILVAGAGGAIFLGTRPSPPPASSTQGVHVYYAAGALPSGTAGATALADGRIRDKTVSPSDVPANAVTDPAQLSGRVAASAIAEGTALTTDMFPAPQTRIGTIVIPPGKRALALELAPVAGISGFAGAGDRIDVYGVVKGDGPTAGVRLVLQGVDVLNVNGAGLPAAQGQPGSPDLIYLLAVTPGDAERLIYLNEFEKLYFDLVPKGEGPVKTPGAGPTGALAV